jgi:UDP-N-acetylmuramoyl-tripeptide--D-alanyl-D-alanine ligase
MERMPIKSFLDTCVSVRKTENIPEDFLLEGVSIDSRTIQPGEMFIAICGENFDGHRFVKEAINKGAVAVVIQGSSEEHISDVDIGKIWVEDTIFFLMELAGWYRSQFDIPIIGLTGSTGKTTTKEMLSAILEIDANVVKTQRNMNNFIGVSLTLFQITRKTQKAIIELGTNHPGEMARLALISQPTHAAITNIGHGHIGFFGSMEKIYEEKCDLFKLMKGGGTAFLNMEDQFLSNFNKSDIHLIKYGTDPKYDYCGKLSGSDDWGRIKFSVNNGPEIQLQIPGRQQFYNGLLAASISLEMGVNMEKIRLGLSTVNSPDKRMEMFQYGGILFINDAYNSNPESLKAAIDFLYDLPKGTAAKKFLVVGDMLELGNQSEYEHRMIGEYLSRKSFDFVFCLGEQSKHILEGLEQGVTSRIEKGWFQNHKDLADAIKQYLGAGDIILVKGSRGMTMENVLYYLGIGRS